jgi:hypothetical protein
MGVELTVDVVTMLMIDPIRGVRKMENLPTEAGRSCQAGLLYVRTDDRIPLGGDGGLAGILLF